LAREYASTVREEQARSTRRRILAAADQLLVGGGYASMTIARLAAEAGVSPQTVYNSVGGKAQVVKAVYDVRLAGDDEPVPIGERPEFRAVVEARTAAECLRRYVDLGQLFWQRVGPLLGALLPAGDGGDPVLADLVATTDRERRTGNEYLVAHLAERFGLPGGWTAERAADLVWTLTSPQVADLLIRRCRWTTEAWGRWVAAALVRDLAP
jgi:AcrR family transcriptional regulator